MVDRYSEDVDVKVEKVQDALKVLSGHDAVVCERNVADVNT
jgi:hypothetical protein